MDYETVFIVLGASAAALAVIVSIIGIRNHEFPKSSGAVLGIVGLFAAILIGTCFTAWQSAAEHQAEHRAEHAESHE